MSGACCGNGLAAVVGPIPGPLPRVPVARAGVRCGADYARVAGQGNGGACGPLLAGREKTGPRRPSGDGPARRPHYSKPLAKIRSEASDICVSTVTESLSATGSV